MERQNLRKAPRWAIVCSLLVAAFLLACPPIYAGICTVIITPGPPPTPFPLPGGTTGVPYSQTLTASNCTGPYTFSVTFGALPPGLMLVSTSSTTATITGTPTTAGSYSFTIQANGQFGSFGAYNYTLAITCPTIGIQPSSLPGGTQGTPYNQTLTGVGGQSPYTFVVTSGSLPNGLNLSSSGVISGTPTAGGSFTFRVQATDANNCTGFTTYTITIGSCPPPASPSLGATPAVVNTAQAVTLTWTATIPSGQGSYTVLLSINAGPFANIGTVSSSSASTLSFTYTVTNLAGFYDFKILASSSCGASSFSNVARVTVMAPCPQSPRVTGV